MSTGWQNLRAAKESRMARCTMKGWDVQRRGGGPSQRRVGEASPSKTQFVIHAEVDSCRHRFDAMTNEGERTP